MTKAKRPASLSPVEDQRSTVNKPDKGDPLKQDFRKFLYVIASTLIYAHLAPRNRRAAIATLEEFNRSLNKAT